jgi:hypothetical protein
MGNEAPKKHKGGYRQINKTFNICAFDEYLEAQLSRLPEIADVEQISPRVIRVLGQNAGKVSTQGLIYFIQPELAANSLVSSHYKAQTPTS